MKITEIAPKIVTWEGRPYGYRPVADIDEDFALPGGNHRITVLGCRINKVEPSLTYSIADFLHAGREGWKGRYQAGWSGNYFLTCTCGAPGCNGYWDGVRIHRKKDVVRVSGTVKNGYKKGVVGTGDQVVYFDKKEFDGLREYYLEQFRKYPNGIFQEGEFFFTGRYGLLLWEQDETYEEY